jgi:hypothetical protein
MESRKEESGGGQMRIEEQDVREEMKFSEPGRK